MQAVILAAVHATHVIVDHVPTVHVSPISHNVVIDGFKSDLGIKDSGWSIFAAFAAAAAAVATALLAWLTRNLARATTEMVNKTAALGVQTARQAEESARAIEQAQRHHEQSLMPIVSVSLSCETATVQSGITTARGIVIVGTIANFGLGPATAVYLHFKSSQFTPSHVIYAGLVGPNTNKPFEKAYQTDDTGAGEHRPYNCVTRYRTIFDTWGAIVQTSPSGEARHAVVLEYIAPSADSLVEIEKYLTDNGFPTQLLQ